MPQGLIESESVKYGAILIICLHDVFNRLNKFALKMLFTTKLRNCVKVSVVFLGSPSTKDHMMYDMWTKRNTERCSLLLFCGHTWNLAMLFGCHVSKYTDC